MFLSKRSNGIYYLWLKDELGRKLKVSTGCKRRSETLKFLQSFRESEHERKTTLQRTSLSRFTEEYLDYRKSNFNMRCLLAWTTRCTSTVCAIHLQVCRSRLA
jgi:hypothetical protein